MFVVLCCLLFYCCQLATRCYLMLLASRCSVHRFFLLFCYSKPTTRCLLLAISCYISLLVALGWPFASRGARLLITVHSKLITVWLASSFSLLSDHFSFPPAGRLLEQMPTFCCPELATRLSYLVSCCTKLPLRCLLFSTRSTVFASHFFFLYCRLFFVVACYSPLANFGFNFAVRLPLLEASCHSPYWSLTVHLRFSLLADNRSLLADCSSPLAGGYLNLASRRPLLLLHSSICKTFAVFYLIHHLVIECLGLGNFMATSGMCKKKHCQCCNLSCCSTAWKKWKTSEVFYFLRGLHPSKIQLFNFCCF